MLNKILNAQNAADKNPRRNINNSSSSSLNEINSNFQNKLALCVSQKFIK